MRVQSIANFSIWTIFAAVTLALLLCVASGESQPVASVEWRVVEAGFFSLYYAAEDSAQAAPIRTQAEASCKAIEQFFDTAFVGRFDLYIFPNRRSLDHQWQQAWRLPGFKSECWMLASGVGSRLDFLSTRVWTEQACEHNPNDSLEWRQILTHELTHVFHGQYNSVSDFEGLNDIGWLIEGLAVLVSGQMDSTRLVDAEEALRKGLIPEQLSEVWSGRYRYAVCGSLVDYVDQTYGRAMTRKLLTGTSESEVLSMLHTSAAELLTDWKTSLGR